MCFSRSHFLVNILEILKKNSSNLLLSQHIFANAIKVYGQKHNFPYSMEVDCFLFIFAWFNNLLVILVKFYAFLNALLICPDVELLVSYWKKTASHISIKV